MNDFMTWANLATFAGCAAGTAVITQFLKNIKPLKNVATQWVSYGIALVLLFGATYFTGGLTASQATLIPFNAVVVALAANGAFSALNRVNTLNIAKSADGDLKAETPTEPVVDIEQTEVKDNEGKAETTVTESASEENGTPAIQ